MGKNILICLGKLDIGGVQTVVINQVEKMIELGNSIFVMAQDGIYSNIVKEKGAQVIDFNFDLCNRI